jgi:CheY-like chemotaxis protein
MDDARRALTEPTLVFVEDDPSHAELITRAFHEAKVSGKLRHFSDGRSVIDYLFRENEHTDPLMSPRPYVLLLDLRLPGMDGLEILQQIKGNPVLRRTPVVILTTSSASEDITRAYSLHANSVVRKPTDFTSFIRLIRDLAAYWRDWNQSPWSGDGH